MRKIGAPVLNEDWPLFCGAYQRSEEFSANHCSSRDDGADRQHGCNYRIRLSVHLSISPTLEFP